MSVQFKNNILIKLIAIGFLMLIFLIPTGMMSNLINERQWRSEEARTEVSSKWGNGQTIIGPILTIPYKNIVQTDDNKTIEVVKLAHFLPNSLNISGNLDSEMLSRGIYEVVVYTSDLNFSGEFSQPDFDELNINPNDVIWDDAIISIGISDVRGINENIVISWDNKERDVKPGLGTNIYLGTSDSGPRDLKRSTITDNSALGVADSGIHSRVALLTENNKKYPFNFKVNLNGSQNLSFVPLGMENNVELESSWPSPSFNGMFLPDERIVTDAGFSANWKILEYNRSLPQGWLGENIQNFSASKFGVNLLVGVDQYQKNTRSIKYAIMIIALTFLIFFFVEVMNKIKVHPIQYILVGLAIVLFFSLLLSISEHLNFNISYLISALVTVLMIAVYSGHIFKNRKLNLLQVGILALIYTFIYTIIQLEDYALLVGSIGLFVILAVVMYISRKINWYEEGQE